MRGRRVWGAIGIGGTLLALLFLWRGTPEPGRRPVGVPSGMPMLAVMGGYTATFRPLFADRPRDRILLGQIAKALAHATSLGPPPPQGPPPSFQPDLTLAYARGRWVQILTDINANGNVANRVVLGRPNGTPILLRSRFL